VEAKRLRIELNVVSDDDIPGENMPPPPCPDPSRHCPYGGHASRIGSLVVDEDALQVLQQALQAREEEG
jgi:hypothetical protein